MNSAQEIYIVGASGHAKVIIATLKDKGYAVKAALDDDPQKWGKELLGVPIAGPTALLEEFREPCAIIAIGKNNLRKAVAELYRRVQWLTLVHPSAFVHPTVRLGPGTVVFAGAVIQPDTRIGSHCIINTSASIDHDCVMKDYVHVAPGVNLAGGVQLGQGVFVGIGSAVIPNILIGDWTAIGAGGVVDSDLAGNLLAVGVPARPIKKKE